MRKIVVFIMIVSISIINFTTISAAPKSKNVVMTLSTVYESKNVEVTLSDTTETVNIGETVNLTAITQKQGSSCIDSWSNAVKGSTILDNNTGTYISKASFVATAPGTYTICYSINMSAGGSDTYFTGKVERTITVINPVTLVGADIRDLTISPVYRDGIVYAYSACGNVYALWSDQTTTLYSSKSFYFGLNETEKIIDVTIVNNGIAYNYAVTVKR